MSFPESNRFEKPINLRENFDQSYPDFPIGKPFWFDASFQAFLEVNPRIKGICKYLPTTLDEEVYGSQKEIKKAWSSYKDHGYGYFFYALVRVLELSNCVEIGVLQGFSLMAVAAALRDNDSDGAIYGYDLFEEYKYRHDTFSNVNMRIKEINLSPWVHLRRADAYQIFQQFDSVDYLHVDISNDGDTYSRLFAQWESIVGKVIVFEGGSPIRDQVEWMRKYGKPPITPVIDKIKNEYPDWNVSVLTPFPSMMVAVKNT